MIVDESRPELSLVIPCYNESGNLGQLVERCSALVALASVEVVFVDNGSRDSTGEELMELLADAAGMRIVSVQTNRGYGFGIRAGLETCDTPYLGWTHADLQTDPLDVERGLRLLTDESPSQFAKGRRFGRPAGDRLFTFGMSVISSLLLRKILWDINAQPTLFTREFYTTWVDAPDDFSLDLFAYFQARESGLRIRRFPVPFQRRLSGMSHWNRSWKAKVGFIGRTLSYTITLREKIKRLQ